MIDMPKRRSTRSAFFYKQKRPFRVLPVFVMGIADSKLAYPTV